MATRIITTFTDDIDGSDGAETVEFALDGVGYQIDLSDKNSQKLREILGTYIQAGTRVGRIGTAQHRPRSTQPQVESVRSSREENQAIREWATGNGMQLAERGRIPMHIVEAYHDRNNALSVVKAVKKASGAKAVALKHKVSA